MTKIVGKVHVYRNDSNGQLRTNTPHVDDSGAGTAAATGNTDTGVIAQGNLAKSRRQSTLWHNKLFTVTRNVYPASEADTPVASLAAAAFGAVSTTALSTPTVQSKMEIALAIHQWERSAPAKYRTDYHQVAEQIRNRLYNPNAANLAISNPHITSLPPLPKHLKSVHIYNCPNLRTAPDFSHSRQLETLHFLGCSSLTDPPRLQGCTRLTELCMPGCTPLTRAPDVSDCTQLFSLDLGDCSALTDPPDLSRCTQLYSLTLNRCSALTSLPDVSTCTQLQLLFAIGCTAVTTLPRGWAALQQMQLLDLRSVPLTSVPDDFLALPRQCAVSITAAYFSDAVRNRLHEATHASGYTGPHIRVNLETPPSRQSRNLSEAVQFWRNEASESGKAPKSGWGKFTKEAGAADFAKFLDRLSETGEYRNQIIRANFTRRVGNLLDQLELKSSKALRQHCFFQAGLAIDTCGDRVALALLDMELACALHRLEADVQSGKYDDNPAALCKAGKGYHRLEQLRDISRQKVASLNFVDEIEVYLGYLVKLSKEFDLPIQMNTMLYPEWTHITGEDLANAREQLNAPENGQEDQALLDFLANWSPTRALLGRLVPQNSMSEAEVKIEEKVSSEQKRLHEQMDDLLGEAESGDNKRKAKELMAEFNAVEATVRTEFMAGLVAGHLMKTTA